MSVENVPMTTTICQLLADVLVAHTTDWDDPFDLEEATEISDALLASPLADIIDLNAWWRYVASGIVWRIRDWRANRAEQKPTP